MIGGCEVPRVTSSAISRWRSKAFRSEYLLGGELAVRLLRGCIPAESRCDGWSDTLSSDPV
jgi:hypothetical protein